MPSRAVAYSPNGAQIAIGFGTPIRENSKQFDGKWVVLQEDDFQVRQLPFQAAPYDSKNYSTLFPTTLPPQKVRTSKYIYKRVNLKYAPMTC